jgi:trk system potassium uptake protein TrkH
VSTGGFSTREASFAAFSPRAQWIAAAFMWLGGVNLLLLHRAWRRRSALAFWSDGEFRYYVLVLVFAVALVGGSLALAPPPGAGSFRDVVFQSVSALTGTGYSSAPFGLWPGFAALVLLQLMVLGGMTGSTSGGVKSLRVLLGLRALRVAFARLLHPRAVRSVKYAGRPVPEAVLGGVWAFLTGYLLAVMLVAAVVAGAGYDLLTSLSAGVATLGNVGPGLGAIAPGGGYQHFPAGVKLVLCTAMLAGRVEVFAFLVLASPGFWRR